MLSAVADRPTFGSRPWLPPQLSIAQKNLSLKSPGQKKKQAASYSPALQRSTIGANGLNFSVRNGKR